MKKKTLTYSIALLSIILIGIYTHIFATIGYKPLQNAVLANNTRMAIMLMDIGTPVNPNDGYYQASLSNPPLHAAVENGNYELAKALVNHGASIDWCCCSCITALHLAIILEKSVARGF